MSSFSLKCFRDDDLDIVVKSEGGQFCRLIRSGVVVVGEEFVRTLFGDDDVVMMP